MPENPMPLRLLDFKPLKKGSLLGFAKVRLGKSLVISDVTVLSSHGKTWASMPSKPQLDASGTAMRDANGKLKYKPILEWADREAADRFSAAVIEAVRLQHPDAMEVPQ